MRNINRDDLIAEGSAILCRIRHAKARLETARGMEDPVEALIALESRFLRDQQDQWRRWWSRYGSLIEGETPETMETRAFMGEARACAFTVALLETRLGRPHLHPLDRECDEHMLQEQKAAWQAFVTLLSDEEVAEIVGAAQREAAQDVDGLVAAEFDDVE